MFADVVLRLSVGAAAGVVVAFLVINLGLRLIPEGRAFLAAARGRGRVFARPGRHSPGRVRAVFAVASILAIAAGAAAALWGGPESPPVPGPARFGAAGTLRAAGRITPPRTSVMVSRPGGRMRISVISGSDPQRQRPPTGRRGHVGSFISGPARDIVPLVRGA